MIISPLHFHFIPVLNAHRYYMKLLYELILIQLSLAVGMCANFDTKALQTSEK